MQPSTHPLITGLDCPWLPPISFGIEPYLKLCRTIHVSLKELEARYPSQLPSLSLEGRTKRLKRPQK